MTKAGVGNVPVTVKPLSTLGSDVVTARTVQKNGGPKTAILGTLNPAGVPGPHHPEALPPVGL